VVPESPLKQTEAGLVPEGEGWFVLNARVAPWWRSDELGAAAVFEGEPRFSDLGFHVEVLYPGQPNCMYHGESEQEDFLVVSGECIAIVEGEERPLKAWDFVHCPSMTEHVFVGAGAGPCVIVMVGARKRDGTILYPVNAAAAKHGASVLEETPNPQEAYARFPRPERTPYRDGDLPDSA
jgi:uncharacterized cupin superfamily protein